MKRFFHQPCQRRIDLIFLTPIAIATFGLLSQAANAGPFAFRKIVDTHTLVPGTSEFFSFNASDVPAIDGMSVVFDTGNQTYWTATLGKSGKRKILSSSRKIPGWNGTFQQFYGDTVRISDGTVVFVGMDCGGCNSGVGLYKVPGAGGAVTELVDKNDFLPGSATAKFGNFPIDFKVRNGVIAFQNAQKLYAVPVAGGPVTAVAGDQDSGFKPPAPYCCIFISPDVKEKNVAMLAGNIFGRGSIQVAGVSGNPLSFRVIADGSTHPPGTVNGKNYVMDDFTFSSPVIDQARD